MYFINENVEILIWTSPKYFPEGPNISAIHVQHGVNRVHYSWDVLCNPLFMVASIRAVIVDSLAVFDEFAIWNLYDMFSLKSTLLKYRYSEFLNAQNGAVHRGHTKWYASHSFPEFSVEYSN